MNKISLFAHLNGSKSSGQEAKTVDVINHIRQKGFTVDVFNYGKMKPLKLIFEAFKEIKNHDSIILMPGGIRALKLLSFLMKFFKKKIIHYVVVGGWITDVVIDGKNKRLEKFLKNVDYIYLQNMTSIKLFKDKGFDNLFYTPTFSSRRPLTEIEQQESIALFDESNKYNFVFFARVDVEKGVILACDAIKKAIDSHRDTNISLDIYGLCDNEETKKAILENYPGYDINLKGLIDKNVIETLSKYYMMLFPTFYFGEGMPHTLVESMMAGVPVIASDWKYNSELIIDGQTGFLFDLNKEDDLYNRICYAIEHKDEIRAMRTSCFKKCTLKHTPDNALAPLIENLNNK